MNRVVIIGAGLAGLASSLRLAQQGADVTLLAYGLGGLPLSTGLIDVYGYAPTTEVSHHGMSHADMSHSASGTGTIGSPSSDGMNHSPMGIPGAQGAASSAEGPGHAGSTGAGSDIAAAPFRIGIDHSPMSQGDTRVADPLTAVAEAAPDHPYAAIGTDAVREGLAFLQQVADGLLVGDEHHNVLLPTAVGALRPTCLAQPSMLSGRCVDGALFAIVGFKRLKDFHPALIAGNLSRTPLPDGGRVQARPLMIDVPAREGEADSSGLTYARAFDTPGFALRVAAEIRPLLRDGETVGLPAVLGLSTDAWRTLADQLGHPVFEIPLPPPSVPGLRLNDALTAAAKAAGVRIVLGSRVTSVRTEHGHVISVSLDTAGHPHEYTADAFVLATGGFESGALAVDSYGHVTETVFDLPVGESVEASSPPASSPFVGLGNTGERRSALSDLSRSIASTDQTVFGRSSAQSRLRRQSYVSTTVGVAGGVPQPHVTSPASSSEDTTKRDQVPENSDPTALSPFVPNAWAPQPLFALGVRVDESMQPLTEDGTPAYDNLYAAGGILGGAQRWREKSGEGIALGSALQAADTILRRLA